MFFIKRYLFYTKPRFDSYDKELICDNIIDILSKIDIIPKIFSEFRLISF